MKITSKTWLQPISNQKFKPYKRALKTLMQEHCGLVIQQEGEGDEFGHDSAVILFFQFQKIKF